MTSAQPSAVTPGSDPREKPTAVADVPVSALRPHPRNPRKIMPARLEQLKRALQADPAMLSARPLIALPDGTVIAGNQRLRAALELGWETIPVVYADLDEARATEWMLRDNRPYGDDDEELTGLLLAELAASGRELDLTGFSSADIDALLLASRPAPVVDPDEVPPLPAKPRSKLGEVYELGPHRLMCGDATDPATFEQLMGDARAAALWTDPPYGVDYVGKTAKALTIANDGAAGLPALLLAAFAAASPYLEPNASFYVAAPAGPRGLDFRLAIGEAGWTFHQALVWVKDSMVLGHSDHHYRHEDILYGWTPGPGRSGRGAHRGSRWYGDNSQTTVFEVARPKRSAEHPTMKPIDLIEPMLANSTQRGDIVLDPFAGSGSTMIAADQLSRRAFMVELDPAYCDVIRDRYALFAGEATGG